MSLERDGVFAEMSVADITKFAKVKTYALAHMTKSVLENGYACAKSKNKVILADRERFQVSEFDTPELAWEFCQAIVDEANKRQNRDDRAFAVTYNQEMWEHIGSLVLRELSATGHYRQT